MHYFDMCHWLLCLIGSCLYKYKPGEERWVDSKTTFPAGDQKPAANERSDRFFVCFSYDSPLVGGEYGFRMDKQIFALCNCVISIYYIDEDKKKVCVYFLVSINCPKAKQYWKHNRCNYVCLLTNATCYLMIYNNTETDSDYTRDNLWFC